MSSCADCMQGKQVRSSFKIKNVVSTTKPLELLHMDLAGPMRVQTQGGARYMFVLVDDYSRFTWTLFLRSKNEVYSRFSELVPMLEKSLNSTLRAIRSDHGTEFENGEMLSFCRDRGISHNFSAPRTPQQNGVVERKNRTLEDMARTMLISSGLAPSFWAEAVNTACYIINRAMLRPILDKTPYELLGGLPPSIAHLRVFGCKCFVHNNGKDNLGKFDARSDEAIFLGYSPTSKAYKVLNKRTKRVEESIHVVFDENVTTSSTPYPQDPFPASVPAPTTHEPPNSTLNPASPESSPSPSNPDSDSEDEAPPKRYPKPVAPSHAPPHVPNEVSETDSDSSHSHSDCSDMQIFLPELPELPRIEDTLEVPLYDSIGSEATPPESPLPQATLVEVTLQQDETSSRTLPHMDSHPPEQMITPLHSGVRTRSSSLNLIACNAFVSLAEPKNIK